MTAGLRDMEMSSRLGRLRERLEGAGCDALVATALSNIRYLTGFTGSAAMLLVTGTGAWLTTDGRYRTQSGEQLAAAGVEAEVVIGTVSEQQVAVAAIVASMEHPRVGLEAAAVTWATQRALQARLEGARLVPTLGMVEALRCRKDPGELDRMAAAAAIADAALGEVLGMIVDGRTEMEVAIALDSAMVRRGADGPAFETIVAAGPNGAKPHARPTPRPIGRGELVVIDFGATVQGYRSDTTRTFSAGEPIGESGWRMYEVVRESQAAGVATVRSGLPAASVDQACRDVIARAGWADRFVHSTGHGVGLDIHEAPAVSATSADTLEEASAMTVEPGVYLPGHGGVRIEDTLVVTADGSRALTGFPKDLVIA